MKLDALGRTGVYNPEASRRLAELRRARGAAEPPAKPEALHERLQAAGRIYDLRARRKKIEALLAEETADARALLIAGGFLYVSGGVARGRALLAEALRLDGGTLGGGEAFSALMKLGRHKEAVARGERVLDGKPSLDDMRWFWNPWGWDERGSPAARRTELAKMARTVGARSPWLHFYRGDLGGAQGLASYARLAAFPAKRYGWMLMKAGRAAFNAGRFDDGVAWLTASLGHTAVDWRARGYLAEGLLCLGREQEAFAQLDRALRDAPEKERGDVLAWRGALDLWTGRYEEALGRLEEACGLGATFAYCWRGGALVKLRRYDEAIVRLDETVRLFPQDFEAYVWRAEAKRELGRHAEALADLAKKPYADARGELPIWLWALVNRALVKEALGDRAGFAADFRAVPAFVIARAKKGREDKAEILRAALDLSRGYRRDDYRQAIWMGEK